MSEKEDHSCVCRAVEQAYLDTIHNLEKEAKNQIRKKK